MKIFHRFFCYFRMQKSSILCCRLRRSGCMRMERTVMWRCTQRGFLNWRSVTDWLIWVTYWLIFMNDWFYKWIGFLELWKSYWKQWMEMELWKITYVCELDCRCQSNIDWFWFPSDWFAMTDIFQKWGDPIVERHRETELRKPAFDQLGASLQRTQKFIEQYMAGVSFTDGDFISYQKCLKSGNFHQNSLSHHKLVEKILFCG